MTRPDGSEVATSVLHAHLGRRIPSDIAASPDGGAVVVTENLDRTASVIKLAASAAIVWERSIDGSPPSSERAKVAVGPSGNVYVATTTRYDISAMPPEGDDIEITAFTPAGDVRPGWPQRINVAFRDWVSDIAVDANDNVHVVGTTDDREDFVYDGQRPYLASYREDGSVLRAAELVDAGSAPPETAIWSQSVALTPDGRLYVSIIALRFGSDGGGDTRLAAFDAEGEIVEGYPMTLSDSGASSPIAVAPNGKLFVLENQRLYTIDANGALLDDAPQHAALPDAGQHWPSRNQNAFTASSTGDLYLVGTARDQPGNPGPSPTSDVFVQSLTPTGASRAGFPVYLATPEWDDAAAIALDTDGAKAWVAWRMPNSQGCVTLIPAN